MSNNKIMPKLHYVLLDLLIVASAITVLVLGGEPTRRITLGNAVIMPYLMLLPFILLFTSVCYWSDAKKSLKRSLLRVDSFLFALLWFWLVASALWTTNYGHYYLEKLLGLFIVLLISYHLGMCIMRKRFSFIAFTKIIYALSVILSLLYIIADTHSQIGLLFKSVSGDYLGFARLAAIGFILSFTNWYYQGFCLFCNSSVMATTLLFGLLVMGGRGPLIALLMSVVIIISLSCLLDKGRCLPIAKMLIFITSLFIILLVVNMQGHIHVDYKTLDRLKYLNSGGRSVSIRINLLKCALAEGSNAPFIGNGLASFYDTCGKEIGSYDYPHNIFAEIFTEQGLVGISLFFLFCVALIFRVLALFKSPSLEKGDRRLLMIILMLFSFSFIEAQFSSDIIGNRYLFMFAGMVSGLRISKN